MTNVYEWEFVLWILAFEYVSLLYEEDIYLYENLIFLYGN